MSITVELDLPQADAERARAVGLLQSEVLSSLVQRELGRLKARENFGAALQQLHSVDSDEMTPAEIRAEIDAVRSERNARREGSR
jgi:hypothetical protein